MLLYVHRDHKDYEGRGALDGRLGFHTAPELSDMVEAPNDHNVSVIKIHKRLEGGK